MASLEQTDVLLDAFHEGRVKVLGRALHWLTGRWNMSPDAFIEAIIEHLESGGRVFRKHEQAGARLLPNNLQASVWIRDPDDDNDYDDGTVYVELVVIEADVILIGDAHEHENGGRNPRLPF